MSLTSVESGLARREQAGKGASGTSGTRSSDPEHAPACLEIPNLRIKFWQLRVNVEAVSGGALGGHSGKSCNFRLPPSQLVLF